MALGGKIKAFSLKQESSNLPDTKLENFNQRLIHDSAAFDFADNDDDFDPEECGPILCEDDDEPDFTKMR